MATKSSTTPEKAANVVPHEGDHDRVQMLSLRADGTPDQHNPEIIGDKEVAIRAAQGQFAQQAVSAADAAANEGASGGTVVEDAPQDPEIEKRVKEHEKVADAAVKAAEQAVNSLHK